MKILRLFVVAAFIISILAGIGAGKFLFQKVDNPNHTSSSTAQASLNVQKSIWFIAVDRLDISTPRLEGMWLLAYIPNYTMIKPLPLLPSKNAQKDAELAQVFRITSGKRIASGFWDYMQKNGHLAGDYIVVDEIGAVSIINIFGGYSIQGNHITGLEALTHIPRIWDDPQGSLQGQIAVMDYVCKSIFNTHPLPNLDGLQKEYGKHIISNLDLSRETKDWKTLIENGKHKVCDFSDLYEQTQVFPEP